MRWMAFIAILLWVLVVLCSAYAQSLTKGSGCLSGEFKGTSMLSNVKGKTKISRSHFTLNFTENLLIASAGFGFELS